MNPGDSPVFLFSASWRTGSTLVQRLLNTTPELIIWGEPQMLIFVRRAFEAASRGFESVEWARDKAKGQPLHDLWVPTIRPAADNVLPAFRKLFEHLYAKPSLEQGYRRWGFKEVRREAVDNAIMLKTLYPQAKFVFLYRHPFDTYASLKRTDFHRTFNDPLKPMLIWAENYSAFFSERALEVDPFHISYEQITSTRTSAHPKLQALLEHVGIRRTNLIDDVLDRKLGSTSSGEELLESEKNRIRQHIEQCGIDLSHEYPDV